jgi:hypothetical protein
MNKWQIICPLIALTIAAIIFALLHAYGHRRIIIATEIQRIGYDLVTTTNSTQLVRLGPDLQARLAELAAFRLAVKAVKLGDDPIIGDGKATSRLFLSNSIGDVIGIRLRQSSGPHLYNVLGYWTVTRSPEPPGL